MATRVTLLSAAADSLSVEPISAGTSERLLADISSSQGSGLTTTSRADASGGAYCTNGLFHRVGGTGNAYVWITKPLQAVTVSGTVTANLWMSESNMSANCGAAFTVWQCENDGTFVNLILGCRPFVSTASGTTYEKGTELPIGTRTAQNWTATPTSRTLTDGQRICIAAGIGAVGTMGSGHTCDFSYAGTSAGADGDSWIEFTETLSEAAGEPNPPSTKLIGNYAVTRSFVW